MSSTLDKARELGAAISKSEEYLNLKRAEEDIYNDMESLKLFKSIDKSEENHMKTLKDEKVSRYIECQNRYNTLMRDINTIISYYTGYESESGDCSSCSGCGNKKKTD